MSVKRGKRRWKGEYVALLEISPPSVDNSGAEEVVFIGVGRSGVKCRSSGTTALAEHIVTIPIQ